ncbi:MAG: hypothetical protein JKY56_14375 [Kofleriaceae bacterium]|nr:hypothetical protein [Kofleriaceae bacterium]
MPLAGALAAFAICSASPVFAQDADAPAEDAMTDEEKAAKKAAEEKETAEKQAKATALYQEGAVALAAADYTLAVSKFEEAYENFPDVQLQVKIGEAYQRDGTASLDYDKLQKAIEAYRKYVDKVPEGKTTDAINGRIFELEESIQNEEDRKQRVIDEEKKAQETAKADEEKKAKTLLAKEKLKKEMQIVFSGGLLAGSDQDLTGIIRMSGGALLSWEKFAVDAKLGIDGFLRIDKERGIRGKSFPVLDVGVRYGLNYRYVGPFFSGGASFGLINGKPRERLLKDDDATCGGGDCAFSIDKTITARVGIGYGFRATETSTVALKIELQNWFFSVDDEQGIGSVPAGSVDKPQTSFAVMFGLEFLRWL